MLVLSRKKGDAIALGDDILVEVVEIRGDKVRLGVTCASEIPVHRKEVWEAIHREALRAEHLPQAEGPAEQPE